MIRLSIRRPVAVTMLYVSVALLGVAAWRNIPLELLPDKSFPSLTVQVTWQGSSPETVEAFATSPVEASIQQIKGVRRITSTSREGGSSIQVEFNRDVDMDFVRMELSERMVSLEEELPAGVQPLRVQPYIPREFQAQATQPFLEYTFSGPLLMEALKAHLETAVVPELMRIQGVSEVEVHGGRDRLLEIQLDPDRIAALGLQPNDVATAIGELDLVRQAGAIRSGSREWALTIRTRPVDAQDIRDAYLPGTWEAPVRVDQVAEIRDTFEDPRQFFRISGSPAIGFTVHPSRGVNVVELAETVKQRVEELQALNPAGSEMELIRDQSEDVRSELTDLTTRAGVAAIVIFLVLLGFLRSFRTAGIVFATIAFSVLIALNMVYFGGLSLNLLTLMGLALGFGLIVDNSIVVLENIYRQWEHGASPEEAAEKGARDVVLPIFASTATTCIVFVPFLYLQGELRIYYLPLAIVVGLTLVASIFVAFTFIPALAARLLDPAKRDGRAAADATEGGAGGSEAAAGRASAAWAGEGATPEPPRASDPWAVPRPTARSAGGGGSDGMAGRPPAGADGTDSEPDDASLLPSFSAERPPIYIRFYSGLLGLTLKAPWVTVAVAVFCFAGGYYLFMNNVSRQAVWGSGSSGRSYIMLTIQMPRGTDLERMDEFTRFFEDRLARMPEVERYETNVYDQNSSTRVDFPEELEFTAVPFVIEEQLKSFALGFSGATIRVTGMGPSFSTGGMGGAAPNYRITFLGYNYERLAELAGELADLLEGNSRIHEVDRNASSGYSRDRATEFVVLIDRDAAARQGVTATEVASLIQANVRGSGPPRTVMVGGEQLQYEVRLQGFRQADVKDLEDMVVTTSNGMRVPIGALVDVEERRVLSTILREDQQYERTVAYEFRGPRALGDFVRDGALESIHLPPGYSMQERSYWRIPTEERRQMAMVLLIAIGLVFMVTAALFESIRQPMVVLLAVPMALIGVFLIFFYTGASFTREARIGVIMMGGIVVNNAILLVDHINRVRAESGLSFTDAIVRGTLERVRPILMTTATTVLGLLPLVLFTRAADATIWNALTYALIGGLLSSTLFVLVTTPSLYLIFERAGRRAEDLERSPVVARSPGDPEGGGGAAPPPSGPGSPSPSPAGGGLPGGAGGGLPTGPPPLHG